jgi:hypothetical protein
MTTLRFSIVGASLLLALAGLSFSAVAASERLGGVRMVELTQPLTIEDGWARSFVQRGRPVLFRDLAKFEPYCSFEVTTVARGGAHIVVNPDMFSISRIQHKHISGGIFAGALNSREDVGPVEPEVDIYLVSNAQPSVIRMRCIKWEGDAIFARPVNLNEIRAALGTVAVIR